jgi:hypothetical protein
MYMKQSRVRKYINQQNVETLKNLPNSLTATKAGKEFISIYENLVNDTRHIRY